MKTSREKAIVFQKRMFLTGITDDLEELLDQHAKDQRDACEKAIVEFTVIRGFSYPTTPFEARMACRNAVIGE